MPPKNMTVEQRQEEKNIILRQSLKILSEEGYQNVTMRKIGRACNFSHAKIYYYFDNKDEVIASLVDNGFEILRTQLEEYCEKVSTGKEKFIEVLKGVYNFGIKEPNYFNLMFGFGTPKCSDFSGTRSTTVKEHASYFYGYYSDVINNYAKELGVTLTRDEVLTIFIQVTGVVWFENAKLLAEIEHNKEDLIECTINNVLLFLSSKSNGK